MVPTKVLQRINSAFPRTWQIGIFSEALFLVVIVLELSQVADACEFPCSPVALQCRFQHQICVCVAVAQLLSQPAEREVQRKARRYEEGTSWGFRAVVT